jgi:hypothetical protein
MTSRSILVYLIVRVGLGIGFLVVLFLTIFLCNNAVMHASGRTTRTIIQLLSGKSPYSLSLCF